MQEWERELKGKSLSNMDKVELIKGKAKLLEESARRKEQLAKVS